MLHAASAPLKVLVVDDDPGVGRAVSRALKSAGYDFAVVDRCRRARELSQSFDVAVLDLELPDGSGVELGSDLLASGRVQCVVFFSATADSALLRRASELGEVVAKHDDPELLIDAVTRSAVAPVSALRGTRRAHARTASSR